MPLREAFNSAQHGTEIQALTKGEFFYLLIDSVIRREAEIVIESVLHEQFHYKNQILKRDMSHISPQYYDKCIEVLKKRLSVSSIYFIKNYLYVDWSLPTST